MVINAASSLWKWMRILSSLGAIIWLQLCLLHSYDAYRVTVARKSDLFYVYDGREWATIANASRTKRDSPKSQIISHIERPDKRDLKIKHKQNKTKQAFTNLEEKTKQKNNNKRLVTVGS